MLYGLLLEAAPAGHIEIMDLLLDNGADPNRAHPTTGDTAMILAAFRGQSDIVSMLAEHNEIEIDKSNSSGITPLMLAAAKCSTKTVEKYY